MKPGLVSISFREISAEQIVQLVLESGLQGIEWGGDVHVPHGDIESAQKVGQLTRKAGLEVASYGSYYRFEECYDAASSDGPSMESVLETAVALGAPAIRVWAGRAGPYDTPKIVLDTVAARAREFGKKASVRGIRLDFEFHENTLTETAESTVELMLALQQDNLKTLWQPPLHTSCEDRLAGLEKVAPWVSNIHCNYFGQNPWPDVLDLADGEGEWIHYLDVIKNLQGERWILIEHVKGHSPDQFPKDAATLKRWLENF